MKLRQLEALHAVVSAGSMTGAARLLNVTQPAVSALITNFEKELGIQLFLRRGGRLDPTPEGLAIYADVADLFADLEDVAALTRELAAGDVGPLSIAASASIANGILARAVATFLQDRPKVSAELVPLTSARVVDSVLDRDVELGIAIDPAPNTSIITELLFTAEIHCVMAASHPLAVREGLELPDLRNFPVVTYLPHATLRPKLEALFARAGIRTQPSVQVNRSITGMMLARWSDAVALVEPYLLEAVPLQGIVARPLKPSIGLGVFLVWHRTMPRSATMLSFIEHLKRTI